MTTKNQQKYQGYRMLTVIIPLNSHHSPPGRQRNLKLHYLLRCYYYRKDPQSNTTLQYGALCFRLKRQFKKEALLEQKWLTWLQASLQEEGLCPCIFVYDDSGVGNATHLATIPIDPNSPLPAAPTFHADEIENGDSMHPRWHIPIFAVQGIVKPAKTPLQDIHPTPENYNKCFNVNVDFT